MCGFAFGAIEVRFSFIFSEIGSAFDSDALATTVGTHVLRMMSIALVARRSCPASLSGHLGPLLSQDRLARQLNAIAFDRQNLY
jgi:hypothetical protein